MKIPYNKIYFSGNEVQYISDAVARRHLSGDGHYTKLVASYIEEKFKINKCFLTTSATHALEMACMLIDLHEGDEVIMPSFTFPSTANAVMLRGAKPVFAEIDESTLNIDIEDMEKKITENTRAIMPVHYGGVGCKMDRIMDVAEKYGLFVIEDAAQGVNAIYKDKYLGSWGHFGCYSFHDTKNYTSGEGGALLINVENEEICKRAEIIRQKGTNRTSYMRGEVENYRWVDIGSSYLPSDILMALLYSQLNNMDYITGLRKKIFDYYCKRLGKYVDKGMIKISNIPLGCCSNYHLFYILFHDGETRDFVLHELNKRGIMAVIHFMPLHSSPMGIKLGYKEGDLTITERVGKGLLRLPMYIDMTENEMNYVADNLIEILERL